MSRYIIPLILVSFLFGECKGEDKNRLIVEIQVPPGEYDSIVYYLSKNSFTAYSLWQFHTEYFDSLGNIRLNLETNEINWFFITFFKDNYKDRQTQFKNRVFMLVRPGESYKISYNSEYPLLFKVEGNFEEGQNLLNSFEHERPFTNHNNSDTVPVTMLSDLQDSINHTLRPFLNLLNQGEIDGEYFQTAKSNIEYHYATAYINHLQSRNRIFLFPKMAKYQPNHVPLDLNERKYIGLISEVYNRFPYDNPHAKIYGSYHKYLDDYFWYLALYDSSVSKYYTKHYRGTAGKKRAIQNAGKYLNEELSEYYFASRFGFWSPKETPDSVAMLYREFKDRFPNSPFLKGVERHVLRQTGWYSAFYFSKDENRSSEDISSISNMLVFPPEVRIIKNDEVFSSFDSLLAAFRGKPVLIDFWASWCPPCRYEFRFADSLYDFLEEHNYELLYISTDEHEENWLKTIQNYNLKGHHYRVDNKSMKEDLQKIIYFLPTYMIIDSSGKIIVEDAEKPHTKSKLYKQLLESIK